MFSFGFSHVVQGAAPQRQQRSRSQPLSQTNQTTSAQQYKNSQFNVTFFNALVKSEGQEIAESAVNSVGLPKNWLTKSKALNEREMLLVRNEAETIRIKVMEANEHDMHRFAFSHKENSLFHVFNINNPNKPANAWSSEDAHSIRLHEIFERQVKQDPKYAQKLFTTADFTRIAIIACNTFYAEKKAQFVESYPHLAHFASGGHILPKRQDCQAVFAELKRQLVADVSDKSSSTGEIETEVGDFVPVEITDSDDVFLTPLDKHDKLYKPDQLELHPLSTESKEFRDAALHILNEIEKINDLINVMAYEPKGWDNITKQLTDKFEQLSAYQNALNAMKSSTKVGKKFALCLYKETDNQKKLLLAKMAFISDVAKHDPFSEKVVAYNNLLWAHAANYILKSASSKLNCNRNIDRQINKAVTAEIKDKTTAYMNAQTNVRVAIPSEQNKSSHPVLQGKLQCIALVTEQLKFLGLSDEKIVELTNKKIIKDAWRRALNNNQEWAPHTRTILAHKNGVTRCYRSTITPGLHISNRFRCRYQSRTPLEQDGPPHPPVQGVSSAETADHYHARNLKISKLESVNANGTTTLMATVVGHGVLDSWNINDGAERAAANKRAAHEVLEAAIVTDDRIHAKALAGQKVKINHVSVNLTTPAGWREKSVYKDTEALKNYQELTYTKAQFKAFQENSGTKISFQLEDANGVEKAVKIDVNTFTFSFAINPLATGTLPDFVGGWAHVYDHNYSEMTRYIGDLGTNDEFGSRVQAQRPGGFIGNVMDKLQDPANVNTLVYPEKINALVTKLQQQTDTVRHLFLSGAFKRGNGDPAKMGREILALQVIAADALQAINDNEAATSSKGCKSDKDRGGVTDVELKHKLITEDLGGVVVPDAVLSEEDQANYNNIAASTQFTTQQNSIGLPGSKEAYKLTKRIPDPVLREFLTGLSKFSSE